VCLSLSVYVSVCLCLCVSQVGGPQGSSWRVKGLEILLQNESRESERT